MHAFGANAFLFTWQNVPCRAIACGVISAIICIVRIILFKVMPVVPSALDIVLSLFLTTLWVFGTAFNTESPDGVFKSTNNGYFSTWYVQQY